MAKGFKRGSSRYETKANLDIVQIREYDKPHSLVKGQNRLGKKRGRFESSFWNKDGNYQYLVAYDPVISGALFVVREVLTPPTGHPPPLPTLPPPYQGEIIELKIYYRDEDTGERKTKTWKARGREYNSAYKAWKEMWDKLLITKRSR